MREQKTYEIMNYNELNYNEYETFFSVLLRDETVISFLQLNVLTVFSFFSFFSSFFFLVLLFWIVLFLFSLNFLTVYFPRFFF
uniref:Uncharacterized protein n=1 Tax=Octopus bimaculoides TaxID=37653 RepID=A0A0L8G755_OCTBM